MPISEGCICGVVSVLDTFHLIAISESFREFIFNNDMKVKSLLNSRAQSGRRLADLFFVFKQRIFRRLGHGFTLADRTLFSSIRRRTSFMSFISPSVTMWTFVVLVMANYLPEQGHHRLSSAPQLDSAPRNPLALGSIAQQGLLSSKQAWTFQ
jgi:hypothetical protein